MKATGKWATLAGAALLVAGAVAAPSVEVTNVQQQYPWKNTVDITYTVQGVKTHQVEKILLTNETYFVAFEAQDADGNAIADVSGNTVITNALVNGSGSGQIAQWQPALNQQLAACKLTPSVLRGEENAYLVINLETNAEGRCEWWYEPMSTQDASNTRYNTDEYKTTKLVLRRIPAGTYQIGMANLAAVSGNRVHAVIVSANTCYYIGVFPVTQAQYDRVMGEAAPSTSTRPKCAVTWMDLRGGALPETALTPDPSHESSFFIRLGGLSGLALDLPTEEMFEIAERMVSGVWTTVTTAFFWGDTYDNRHVYKKEYWQPETYKPVGGILPNGCGLYDLESNVWQWCRDTYSAEDLAEKTTDIYTPNVDTTGSSDVSQRRRRGTRNADPIDSSCAAYRGGGTAQNAPQSWLGFRAALVIDNR